MKVVFLSCTVVLMSLRSLKTSGVVYQLRLFVYFINAFTREMNCYF